MEISGASSVPFYARTDSTGGLNSGPAAAARERMYRAQRAPAAAKAKYTAWTHQYARRMNTEPSRVRAQSMAESSPVPRVPANGNGGPSLYGLMGHRYNAGRLFNAYA